MKRPLYALLGLIALIALPLSSYMALTNYQAYQDMRQQVSAIDRSLLERERSVQRAEAHAQYLAQATDFVTQAHDRGLHPERWVPYSVSLVNRPLGVDSFLTLMDSLRHGHGYYFEPRRLEMTQIGAATGGAATTRVDTSANTAHQGLRVSLEGTYWVYDAL